MSPRRRLIPSVLAATTAAVLALGGCSSGSGAAAAPSATPTASTSSAAVATSSAPTAAAAVSAEDSASDTSAAATSSDAADGSKVPAEPAQCASIAQTYGAVAAAMLPVLQGKTGPTPFDAEALSKATKGDTMGTIPAELAPDFAAFSTAAEQLRGKDLTAATELLNGAEVAKASSHIDQFLADHC